MPTKSPKRLDSPSKKLTARAKAPAAKTKESSVHPHTWQEPSVLMAALVTVYALEALGHRSLGRRVMGVFTKRYHEPRRVA